VDQQGLVGPVVKASHLVEETGELYRVVREACRVAREGVPGPVFVEVPANLYLLKGEVPDGYREGSPAGIEEINPSAVSPAGEGPGETSGDFAGQVSAAAHILQRARRPLLYLGAGATGAGADLVRLAEKLEAPVSTTFQGKGVFPEKHALFLWPGFGDAAPGFVRKIASSCDVTLAIGCRFGEVGTGSYGMEPPSPLIHVDLDPQVFHKNYPAELAVEGDAGRFVGALLEELSGWAGPAPDPRLRGDIRTGHTAVWEEWLGDVGGKRVTPAHLLRTLQDSLGPDAIFTTDSGNGTFLAVECLRLESPGKLLAPVDFSCMGYAVPAAIGAKLGRPDAPVVALSGDGAFLMTGLELLTAAREGIGVMALVLRDRELAQIAQFQATALSRKVASRVDDYSLERFAEGMGVEFLPMETDDTVGEVVEEAWEIAVSGRPVLVEVAIDYSRKTYFTRGVVKTNLLRLPLGEQARFLGRALLRKLKG
jgi:acetolactate synthase-1/2/3 large subunit